MLHGGADVIDVPLLYRQGRCERPARWKVKRSGVVDFFRLLTARIEISRVLKMGIPEGEDINFSLLEHVSCRTALKS